MHAEEAVAENFDVAKQDEAQRVTWQVLHMVAAQVRPGHRVQDLRALLTGALATHQVEKMWHPPQLRLGKSTRLGFGLPAVDDAPLAQDDIFFVDIGPIVAGYEGDCGETFALGDNTEMQRCAADAKRVHGEGLALWRRTRCTGEALYTWAGARARELGWDLALQEADGHRIGDLPHHRFFEGNLAGRSYVPEGDRWIFEVQLLERNGCFGAFYEDTLR